jgi:DNA-directed RNA polymerase subunit RPC12/RpoP
MPIATRCTHCGKAYQVAETTLGKQVKCQACGKAFVVAKAAPTAPGGPNDPRTTAAAKTAAAKTVAASPADVAEKNRVAKLEAELGLQPLPPNLNRVFPNTDYQRPRGTPSPLANHIVEDPGFDDISEADYTAHQAELRRQEQEAKLDYFANLSTEDDLTTNAANKDFYWLYTVAIVQLVAGILLPPLSSISPYLGMFVIGLPTIVSLWAPTIDAFIVLNRNGRLGDILFLFIPFYNFIFYVANFKIFKHHFFGSIAIAFSIIGSVILAGVVASIMGLELRRDLNLK